jgi:CheY-like chemotaxis protein
MDTALSAAKAEVAMVSSAADALALSDLLHNFEIALIDADMPESDGFELANALRTEWGFRGKVVMMLNAGKELVDVARCRALQLDGHISKPLNCADLAGQLLRLSTGRYDAEERHRPVMRPNRPKSQLDLRILLVEDNPVNRKLAIRLLEKQGNTVFTANNGREGVEKLELLDWRVDLVLMDVQMPEMDGYQATAAIREKERERGGHMPIIAMTAHALDRDRERCLAAGMDGYLSKPIQIDKLYELMESMAAALPSA